MRVTWHSSDIKHKNWSEETGNGPRAGPDGAVAFPGVDEVGSVVTGTLCAVVGRVWKYCCRLARAQVLMCALSKTAPRGYEAADYPQKITFYIIFVYQEALL